MFKASSRSKGKALSDEDIASLITSELRSAIGYYGSEISKQRQKSMEYYSAQPFGNEIDGESQVITQDVLEVVEWALPSLLRIFTTGDKFVSFEPMNGEDHQAAEQKSDYVNHVFVNDCDGFMVLYTMFKDALLQKNGVTKTWWDESDEVTIIKQTNVTLQQIEFLSGDPELEVTKQRLRDDSEMTPELLEEELSSAEMQHQMPRDQIIAMGLFDPERYDITIQRTRTIGKVMVENVPPEEFLIARRQKTIADSPFTAHRYKRSVSKLVADGYNRVQLDELGGEDAAGLGEYHPEKVTRHAIDEEFADVVPSRDASMREVWVSECFVHMDKDGNGTASLYRVVTAGGDNATILKKNGKLDIEEVDEQPFDSITPLPIPHKFYGMSLADLTMDLQFIRSTLMRQLLNNAYNINNARTALDEDRVNLEDFLTQRVGGYVRVEGDPGSAMVEMRTTPIIGDIVPVLTMMEDQKQARTGVTKLNQGLDADTLNETSGGQAKLMAAANQRVEMIARIFAETGVKSMMLRIQRLTINNQDKARTIQLRGKWVDVNPKSWEASLDARIHVGLGYDNKEQESALLLQNIGLQQQIAEAQQGLDGPIVDWGTIYESANRFAEASGLRRTDQLYRDPRGPDGQAQGPEQKPDPAAEMAQAQMQLEMKKLEMEDQREKMRMQLEHTLGLLKLKQHDAQATARQHLKEAEQAVDASTQSMTAVAALETARAKSMQVDVAANANNNGD